MKHLVFIFAGLLLLIFFLGGCGPRPSKTGEGSERESAARIPLLIASYAETPSQAENSLNFADSFRTFAGSMKKAPIRIYLSDQLPDMPGLRERLLGLNVEVRTYHVPEETRRFILAGKPAAAARAETEADGEAEILAFLDTNVLMFGEPKAFRLEPGKDFAYRPVFHQNVGSLFQDPADSYWNRIYSLLEVDPSVLFPMEAAADKHILRPYYNAGYLVARPERGLLRKWAEHFALCTRDSELIDLCRDQLHNIFLHQAVLSATVPVFFARDRTLQLPDSYNYPLFFEKFYASKAPFNSLEEVVSIKIEFSFADLPQGWEDELKAPADVIEWIQAHLTGKDEEDGGSHDRYPF